MGIKFKRLENSVLAEKEYDFPYYLEGVKPDKADVRVLFIGNSITVHEKKRNIGWKKVCGMAASDLKHDYVHLVFDYIKSYTPNSCICVVNSKELEFHYDDKYATWPITDLIKQYCPDMTIIRFGDNFNFEEIEKGKDPSEMFNTIIKAADKVGNVLITSLFWPNEKVDKMIKKIAEDNDILYADISDLSSNEENTAKGQFKNIDVCRHPNDFGMKRIAERITSVIEEYESSDD